MVQQLKKLCGNEIVRYAFIGGCTTMVNIATFWLLCNLSPLGQSDAGITISNVISISVAILFAYVANKRVVFRSETNGFTKLMKEFGAFVGARLGTMAIEVGGVYLTVSVWRQGAMLGKIGTQILVVIGNYFISKFLVFKRR